MIGRCVLVTGAGAGMGRVVAQRFADAGARVAVCDSDAEALDALHRERPDIATFRADMSSQEDIQAMFGALSDQFNALDVLVNNVGISGPTCEPEDISLEDWNHTLAVNLTSYFLCASQAIPGMKARGSGAIINVSSGSASVGLPLRLPYVVSKGAVLSLTSNLARELGPFGIRVNAVLPGPIEGARIRRVIAQKAVVLGISEDEYERRLLHYTSMRTMVTPEDIAEMIFFLGSPAAARISGQLIGVDGNLVFEE